MPAISALNGIRVIELCENLPGPYCGKLLLDLGAKVLRISHPKRKDPATLIPAFYQALNQGKTHLTLDLKNEHDRHDLAERLKTCDVLIDGFRPGVLDRLGFDAASLQRLRPQLIVCSLTGYGQLSVWRALPCHDLNIQAASGMSAMAGSPRIGTGASTLPVGDFLAAYHAALQITAALLATAKMQAVQLTHIDQDMLTPLTQVVQTWAPICQQSFLEHLPHYGLFPCKDRRRLAIGITTETEFWQALCSYLPWDFRRFYRTWTLDRRIKYRSWLRWRLSFSTAQRSQAEWMSIALKEGLPLSPEKGALEEELGLPA